MFIGSHLLFIKLLVDQYNIILSSGINNKKDECQIRPGAPTNLTPE